MGKLKFKKGDLVTYFENIEGEIISYESVVVKYDPKDLDLSYLIHINRGTLYSTLWVCGDELTIKESRYKSFIKSLFKKSIVYLKRCCTFDV